MTHTMMLLAIVGAAQMQPPAPQTLALSATLLKAYHDVQRNLTEAADKMPDAHYGFRPTPEIKPFGQLVAHTALAQFRTCAVLKGEPNPRKDDKEETNRTKAEQMELLKASTTYCDPLVDALTEPSMTELVKTEKISLAKGLVPTELLVHGMEMYGTMAVYLRLKGIVPPSIERMEQMKSMKKSQ